MNVEKSIPLMEQDVVDQEKSRLVNKKIGEEALNIGLDKKDDGENVIEEKWLTKKAILRTPGFTKGLVESAINDLGISGEDRKDTKGRLFRYYSPEDQKRIETYISSKTKDCFTITGMAGELHVSRDAVKNAIKKIQESGKEIGNEGTDNNTGRICTVYSKEEFELVKSELEYLLSAYERPEGWRTIKEIADSEDLDFHTVQKQVRRLQNQSDDTADGVDGRIYKRPDGFGVYTYFSPGDQCVIIKSLFDGRAPKGWCTIDEMANALDAPSKPTIRKKIDDILESDTMSEGVGYFKNSYGRKVFFCSSEMQDLILGDATRLNRVPSGYYSATKIADDWGVDRGTVKKRAEELGIKGHIYKNGRGNSVVFYSAEEQQQINEKINELFSMKLAPDGYVTIEDLAKEYNGKVDRHVIREKARDLFIGDEKHFFKNNRGRIVRYYSPEEKSIIIEELERSTSGTSIPENALAYYLMVAGQKIQQGVRPKWLKNPDSGRSLEIDIFVNPPGVCIEYDGCYYHQDSERDMKKNSLARKQGFNIIRIRENGCPELPEDSICIKRQNNDRGDDLNNCFKRCFEILNIPAPDIDVDRDKKQILAFMRERINRKNEEGELLTT